MSDESSDSQSEGIPLDDVAYGPDLRPTTPATPEDQSSSSETISGRWRLVHRKRWRTLAALLVVILMVVYLQQSVQPPPTDEKKGDDTTSATQISGTGDGKITPVAIGSTPMGTDAGTQQAIPALSQGQSGRGELSQVQFYQQQVAATTKKSSSLQAVTKTLQKELEYAIDQVELMEKEIADRDSQMDKQRKSIKKLEESLKRNTKDMDSQSSDFSRREAELSGELNQTREQMVKLQSNLEGTRASLSELKEKFDLQDRQYQSEVASFQESIERSTSRSKELLTVIEEQKSEVQVLKEKINFSRRERALQHIEKAREHISILDTERSSETQQHLEGALQHLYSAGKVDPKNSLMYRQMALELVDEQMDRLRQRKGKRAESGKRMKLFKQLRSELEGV